MESTALADELVVQSLLGRSHARRHRWKVSAVIPAMNEARSIAWVLEGLPASVDEVILVDGNSKDDTVAIARRVRPDVVVTGQERPGKGAALRAGFAAATGDAVVMLDADGSMDPAEIDSFIDRLAEGYDVVKGSRFVTGGGTSDMTPIRMFGNSGLVALVNRLYGAEFSDLCYGYVGFRREALERLGLVGDGFEIETEIAVSALTERMRIGEVASFESPRHYGDSNLNAVRDGLRVMRTLLGTWVAASRLGPARGSEPVSPVLRTSGVHVA